MESNAKAARPYAIAAFRQATEENQTEQWSGMLALLVQIASDPTMTGLIPNPKVARSELAELIVEICGDRLSGTGTNFVRILAENRRLNLIRDIAAAYEIERAHAEHRTDVVVTMAHELSEAQRNDITAAMTKRLGTKVELSVEVDPKLIGGVVIRAGDTVIDASVRGRLEQLAQAVA